MENKLEQIRGEIEEALRVFYVFKLFREMLSDNATVKKLNSNPEFWILFESAMLTKLFICVRRVFDQGHSAYSFHKFIKYAIDNIKLFSLESIRARKLEGSKDANEWIDDYMSECHQASSEDIAALAKLVRDSSKKMKGIYTEVASKVYAHAVLVDHNIIADAHSDLKYDEIERALLSTWHSYNEIWQMYQNGKNPSFQVGEYQYREEVEDSLLKQVGIKRSELKINVGA